MAIGGFLFGGNTGQSYEQLQRRREMADRLAQQIMGKTPKTAMEGVGALLTGAAAGIGRYRADKAMQEGQDKAVSNANQIFDSIVGQPGAALGISSSSMSQPGASSEIAASKPFSGGDIYNGFMGTVKNAGLTNPYGLAAVAATGRAESGFSPQNANRSWSDPSESGQPGMAGGIMSWRGPRLQALHQYAATKGERPGSISPQTQAEFFAQEDPQLIARLNSAQSVEEAQGLMNNAWKFAGYNRPGGESARRAGYASAFLPEFQGNGSGAGAQVASLDPSAGMSPAAAAIETQAPRSGYVDPAVKVVPLLAGPAPASMPQQGGAEPNSAPPQAAAGPRAAAAPQVQPPQQGAQAPTINPQLYRLVNDPFLPPEMKETARMLLQQQIQAQQHYQQEQAWRARQDYEEQQRRNAPDYQLGLEYKRSQIDAANKKGANLINAGGGNIYNPVTGEWITPPKNPDAPLADFDDISGLRKEVHQLPSYKNMAQALPIYRSMFETADRDSKASDLNLVYGLGKIMDPTSVVREGEMVMVNNTSSLPDWLQGAISSVNGGAKLTPETRQALMREAYGRMQGYQTAFQQDADQYNAITDRYRINRDDVVPSFGEFDEWTLPPANLPVPQPAPRGQVAAPEENPLPPTPGREQPRRISSPEELNALPSGAEFIAPDGTRRRKP